MSDTIPNEIVSYLLDDVSAFKGIFIIKTDKGGLIDGWQGNYLKLLKKKPNAGTSITELFPFLTGIIPFEQTKIQLPNIHFDNDKYFDVHIVKDTSDTIWFIFVDTSVQAKSLEKVLQEVNERRIKFEKKIKTSTSENPFGHLELFQIASFEKHGTFYSVAGKPPEWTRELIKGINITGKHLDLVEIFPFLEVFESEASKFWDQNEKGLFKSGIWAQESSDGKNYPLRSFAANLERKHYLFIWLFDGYLPDEQEIIQKAREQQLAFEKLAKAESRLKELLDYKEKFVSIISHDLRSPIASVYGVSEMLINDKELNEKLDEFSRESLLDIKSEMGRLLDYNAKLYHWSNLELGNFNLIPEDIQVSELIKIVKQTEQQEFKRKNISFFTNLENDLTVKVDITLFLQALNNLVSNAIKFTPENGSITIDAFKKADSNTIIISVSDTGVGMSEDVRKNIFSKHTTSHGTAGEKGSGLGLGIVKKVIDAHGFSIDVESEEGKGTRFSIII